MFLISAVKPRPDIKSWPLLGGFISGVGGMGLAIYLISLAVS